MIAKNRIALTFAAATAVVALAAGCGSDADVVSTPTPADSPTASAAPTAPMEIVKPVVFEGQPDWCFDIYKVFLDPSMEVADTANRIRVIADGPAAGTAIEQPLADLLQFVQDYPEGPATQEETDKLLAADEAVQQAFSQLCGGKTMEEAYNETMATAAPTDEAVPAP